jgi:hypothetical protein
MKIPKPSDASRISAIDSLVLRRWSCTHFGNHSEIEVLDLPTGSWETLATVYPTKGVDAEDVAALIVEIVNDYISRGRQAI